MKHTNMSIKKRMHLSNIFVITFPIVITIVLITFCLTLTWISIKFGNGLRFIDSEDFYKISQSIFETIEDSLEKDTSKNPIDELNLTTTPDQNGLCISISTESDLLYNYGIELAVDADLLNAIHSLGGEGFISNGSRELYIQNCTIHGQNYSIAILATCSELSYHTLKTIIFLSAFILLLAVSISIYASNAFLKKHVFNRIESSILLLSHGTKEIKHGNLTHRIHYEYTDEFTPVFENFNDMTHRLKTSLDTTELHEKSRQELLAGISHDLRSPLTSIRAYVEGLLDGIATTEEAQQKYLQTIKNKTEDMDQMISKIFLFSKLEMEDYPNKLEVVNLHALILEHTRSNQAEFLQRGLEINLGHISHCNIYADPYQVKSILNNIFENSTKYKNHEVGTLTITLEQELNHCYLNFKDNGKGVSPQALPHLFEVFYRGDPSRHNPHKGSGLGLAIVNNAVKRMNGRIVAKHVETGGLELLITLPIMIVSNEL